MWVNETVMFCGKRYCLTRLGFGLNVTPQIMKTIVSAVLSQEETVEKSTLAYLNDIYINQAVSPVLHTWVKLAQFGLDCKDSEWLEDRAWVLGLDIRWEESTLKWKQKSVVPGIPEVHTGRTVFFLCGKLVEHLPVCSWLRVAVGVIKPRVNAVTSDGTIKRVMPSSPEWLQKTTHKDPAQGEWHVNW